MPLLSSHLLVQSSSLTLVALAYLLLTSPLSLLQSPSVDLLGSSMHIPPALFIPASPPRPQVSSKHIPTNPLSELRQSAISTGTRELLALLSLILFLFAISQSVLASQLRFSKEGLVLTDDGKRKDSRAVGEEVYALHKTQTIWMTMAGLRVVATGLLVGWIYLGYSERNLMGNPAKDTVGFLSFLANRIVFAVGMSDMLYWGYLWTVLREEAREVAQIIARRRAQDEEDDKDAMR